MPNAKIIAADGGQALVQYNPSTGELNISSWFVPKKLRGKGIGGKLMNKAIDETGGTNVVSIRGQIAGKNLEQLTKMGSFWETPIGKVLQKRGFDRVERLPDGNEGRAWRSKERGPQSH